VWAEYVGVGFRDDEALIQGIKYKVIRETEECYVVVDLYEREVAVIKNKFDGNLIPNT
jgi:hypothetical protein